MKKIYTLLLVFFSFIVGFTACDDTSNNSYEEPDNSYPDSTAYGCLDVDYSKFDEDTVDEDTVDEDSNDDDFADEDNIDEDIDSDDLPYPDEEPDEDILYGCPYTTFSLNVTGDVKDKNGNPIKDIKLIYNYTLEATSKEVTAQSDENGDFVIADEDSNCWGENYKPSKLTVADIDGELNGTFENKEITDMELNCYDNPESGWDKTRICEGVISVILDEKETSDEDFIDNDIVNDEDIVDSDEEDQDY